MDYQIADGKRFREFKEAGDDALRNEVALCRVLIEATATTSPGLCERLLRTLSVLSEKNQRMQLVSGQSISADEVVKLARVWAGIVMDALAECGIDQATVCRVADMVEPRMLATLSTAEPKRLENRP